MRKFAENYYNNLNSLISSVRVTNKDGIKLDFYEGIEKAAELIMSQVDSGHKLMFIGNGASASISSHMSTDFLKNGQMRAISFNDSSLLTCISNDCGYEHVFEKPIEMIADKGDILIAISSSGRSENILLGIKSARSKGCKVITLSGFEDNNPLSSLGDYNFYVASHSYGPVEIIHHSICHCILDTILKNKEKNI
jgi:D-sedoheptulose 7-phosphate isomerase